jgi:phenylpropionate dioxygenase-like ring-hydroxylating dioxygenase large terminal subunit
MLTKAENDLLTQTGPGTPGGALLRRYWQPVALVADLPPGGAPLPLRLLGEDLVLFRDEAGRVGLLGIHCAHRGADLSYGRLEDGGLRCLYHGWLYDVAGRCLEQPGEPAGSTFNDRVRQRAYPCQERAGVIFAYFGPGEPPLLPAYDAILAPDAQRFVIKIFQHANYLQANEGDIDPVHTSYLHRQLERGGRDERVVSGSGDSVYALFGADTSPTIDVEEMDFGLRIYTSRRVGPEQVYLRTSNYVFPNLSAIPGQTAGHGYSLHWHVPIDDEHHWRFEIVYSHAGPLDQERCLERYAPHMTPDQKLIRTPANRYLQDRDEQRTGSYAGIGPCFQVHDALATEGQGPVQDRTVEHLSTTDIAVATSRQLLLRAIRAVEAGGEAPHVVRDPAANDFAHLVVLSEVVSPETDPRAVLQERIAAKRGAAARA